MFNVIGLGLSDEKDITLRGLEVRMDLPDKTDSKFHISMSGNQEFNPGVSGGVHKHIDD